MKYLDQSNLANAYGERTMSFPDRSPLQDLERIKDGNLIEFTYSSLPVRIAQSPVCNKTFTC